MSKTIKLGVISVGNIVITFCFQWYILTRLGVGVQTDSFFAGMTVPQLILTVISSSLTQVLVPILIGEDKTKQKNDAWGFIVIVAIVFGSIAIGLYVTARWWVPVLVPGFNIEGVELTIEITQIQLIGMFLFGVNGVQWAAYNARRQFIWVEVSNLISGAMSLIALYFLLPNFGVIGAAWISTIRIAFQTLLLIPGLGLPNKIEITNIKIITAWQRMKPLIIGTAYFKTDPLIDRVLLSTVGAGSLSLYYLAQQIYGAIHQVLNKSIGNPLLTILSRCYKDQDVSQFWKEYNVKLKTMLAISVAVIMSHIIFGQEILKILIEYKNIDEDTIQNLWWTMLLMAGYFSCGAMGQVTTSAFYASGNTATPTKLAIYTYTVYLPAKFMFFYIWGMAGLAVISSLLTLVNFSMQYVILKKKRNYYESI